jgi:outer membrane biosynthesis protein TonB
MRALGQTRFVVSASGHPVGMQTMEIIRDPRPGVPELPDPGPEPAPPPVPTPIPEPPPEPEPEPDPDRIRSRS